MATIMHGAYSYCTLIIYQSASNTNCNRLPQKPSPMHSSADSSCPSQPPPTVFCRSAAGVAATGSATVFQCCCRLCEGDVTAARWCHNRASPPQQAHPARQHGEWLNAPSHPTLSALRQPTLPPPANQYTLSLARRAIITTHYHHQHGRHNGSCGGRD